MSDLKKSDFENVVEGGPYAHEVDAIRDERRRAEVMGEEPDFYKVFEHATISTGAILVINDINKPLEPVVGPFVENVVFNDEEENPAENGEEESESESAESATEGSASKGPETANVLVPEKISKEEKQERIDDSVAVHKDLEADLFPEIGIESDK